MDLKGERSPSQEEIDGEANKEEQEALEEVNALLSRLGTVKTKIEAHELDISQLMGLRHALQEMDYAISDDHLA